MEARPLFGEPIRKQADPFIQYELDDFSIAKNFFGKRNYMQNLGGMSNQKFFPEEIPMLTCKDRSQVKPLTKECDSNPPSTSLSNLLSGNYVDGRLSRSGPTKTCVPADDNEPSNRMSQAIKQNGLQSEFSDNKYSENASRKSVAGDVVNSKLTSSYKTRSNRRLSSGSNAPYMDKRHRKVEKVDNSLPPVPPPQFPPPPQSPPPPPTIQKVYHSHVEQGDNKKVNIKEIIDHIVPKLGN